LSQAEEAHTKKRVPECVMLRNYSIIAIIFSLIDFKKRLGWREIDEKFHLSTAQDKVTTLIYLVSLNMCLHLCCPTSHIASGLALLEDEQKFKLGGCVGAHKMLISCANISSECMK
jgi:hypothetical protein